MSSNSKIVKVEGIIEESLPGLFFRIKLDDDSNILAHLAGKMRIHRIRVVPGDRVVIELSRLGDDRGRIVRRL